MADLDSARAKLGRAESHFQVLRAELEVFSRGDVISVRTEDNPDKTEEPIRADYFVETMTPIPEGWPALIGDIIQNLRSALDHATWAVIRHEKGRKFAERNAQAILFPIYPKSDSFEKHFVVTNVSTATVAALTRAQPYIREHDHPRRDALWVLRELSNIDKHRSLHIVNFVAHDAKFLTKPALPGCQGGFIEKGALYEGAHIAYFTAPRPKTGVHVHPEITTEIGIEAAPRSARTPLDVGINELVSRVTEAIEDLETQS